MRAGGNAADAAIAANAVLAVTTQHMCGLGGDLFALIHTGDRTPLALNASGRAGSGADPDRLIDAGLQGVPHTGDIAAVTVPGCVDGWVALHSRCGELDLNAILAPAIDLARHGFGASALLAASIPAIASVVGADDFVRRPVRAGSIITRPAIAEILEEIARDGRAGFYEGRFGDALVALGDGEYVSDDLVSPNSDWVDPLHVDIWGHRVWTTPPNSQGYLALASSALIANADTNSDPADSAWAHLGIEMNRISAKDRLDVLSEHADGEALLAPDRLADHAAMFDPGRRATVRHNTRTGDTIYLCAVDKSGMGVSLIQSNASGWGAHLVAGDTGVFLHSRGIGFNLTEDHPARYAPRRRPPHTLSPTLVTDEAGGLRALVGTMGGDAQPQIVSQLLTRLLASGESPGTAISAGRWALEAPAPNGFNTWEQPDAAVVTLEGHAADWGDGLQRRGHEIKRLAPFSSSFGHAHIIDCVGETLAGAADPRARSGSAAGY